MRLRAIRSGRLRRRTTDMTVSEPPDSGPRRTAITRGAPTSHLAFSPAVMAGGWVFVSGQASVDHRGKIVPDSFEGEMRRSMANLIKVLDAAGLTLDDVVHIRAYLQDPADSAEYNRLYAEYFEAPFPARTTISGCLGSVRFEVDAIALVAGPDPSR